MNWMDWVLVGILVVGPLVTVGTIGDARKPITRNHAVFSVILNAILIIALMWSHAASR
jgi:hypothetical protein